MAGLDGTVIAGSVAPCAAGREKGLHVAQDNSLPTALPERGEAHEVELVAGTKVSQAFVESGDCVVTSPLSLGRECRCCNIRCRKVDLDW